MSNKILGQRVYVDANVFIYALESQGAISQSAQNLLASICGTPPACVTSELTLAEVWVQPLRVNNQTAFALYKEFLTDGTKVNLIAISQAIIVRAAELRATHGPKLPDAIHVATALMAGCSTFVTQDLKLKVPASLEVISL